MIDTHKLEHRIKPGKTKINKEFERYDKNIIRMPRQYTGKTLEIFILQGVLSRKSYFYTEFTRSGETYLRRVEGLVSGLTWKDH